MFNMSAENLLQKLREDYIRLTKKPHQFSIFNFFVTAYHLVDYCSYEYCKELQKRKIPLSDNCKQIHYNLISKHFGKDDYQAMRYLANKNKHCYLTQNGGEKLEKENSQAYYSGGINGAPIGALPVNGNGDFFLVRSGKNPVRISKLATEVLAKWENYITKHHLKNIPHHLKGNKK